MSDDNRFAYRRRIAGEHGDDRPHSGRTEEPLWIR